jgi:hypothetical protein
LSVYALTRGTYQLLWLTCLQEDLGAMKKNRSIILELFKLALAIWVLLAEIVEANVFAASCFNLLKQLDRTLLYLFLTFLNLFLVVFHLDFESCFSAR